MKIEIVHVFLPEETVDRWFPARAEHIRGELYRIIDDASDDPVWEFGKGDVVRCRIRKLVFGTTSKICLVASEKVRVP